MVVTALKFGAASPMRGMGLMLVTVPFASAVVDMFICFEFLEIKKALPLGRAFTYSLFIYLLYLCMVYRQPYRVGVPTATAATHHSVVSRGHMYKIVLHCSGTKVYSINNIVNFRFEKKC